MFNTFQKIKRKLRSRWSSVGEGQAAAHIVASGGSQKHWESAAKSRGILETFGIDIDDAANGIPLGHPNPHGQTHTRDFNDRVFNRLNTLVESMLGDGASSASIKSALLSTLRAIGQQVLGGDYNI